MKSPHEWHEYVQGVVRQYPERVKVYDSLDQKAKREVDAVRKAYDDLYATDRIADEKARLYNLVYAKGKTLIAAADECYICCKTAKRWNKQLIDMVAALLGVYKESDSAPALPPS